MIPEGLHPQKSLKAFYKAQVAPYRHARKWPSMDKEVQLVQGAMEPEAADEGCVVFSAFKNSAMYLGAFIEHYSKMGCRWFYFLDDGSDDASREIISRYNNTAVFSMAQPYICSEDWIRGWFYSRFGRGRWAIWADQDELLDFPHSDRIPFSKVLQYLDERGYEGVTACMLDRFSDKPIGSSGYRADDCLSETFPFYDVSEISRYPFLKRELGPLGSVGAPKIVDFYGGVRGLQLGFWPRITKVPLLKYRRRHGVRIHMVSNAKLADFALVLNHYKYVDEYIYHSRLASPGYVRSPVDWNKVETENLKPVYDVDSAERWVDATALYSDLLYASEAFESWMSNTK